MPAWVTPEFTGWDGEHNSYTRSGQKIHYAWFTNAGDLGSITAIISHELVESATDPDGSGFLGVNRTCDGPGWCEIADICESTWASIDGITVHAYWSNQDNACIAPSNRGRYSAAVPAGRRPGMMRCQRGMLRPAPRSLGRGTSPRSSGTSRGDRDSAGAQRPQADPSRATGQQDLAKIKRDAVLHAGHRARGR